MHAGGFLIEWDSLSRSRKTVFSSFCLAPGRSAPTAGIRLRVEKPARRAASTRKPQALISLIFFSRCGLRLTRKTRKAQKTAVMVLFSLIKTVAGRKKPARPASVILTSPK